MRTHATDSFIDLDWHKRSDRIESITDVERHGPQRGHRRRVKHARHKAEDACNAELRRLRRVESVGRRTTSIVVIQKNSFAFRQTVLPIHNSRQQGMDRQLDVPC
jgi:hypothetical protein